MDPESPAFRYTLLLFNCLLTFGSYYCFDMPTVLESKIEAQVVSGFTTEVSTYYNLFYTIYAWTNMCMSLVAGVLVDRIGTRASGFLFLSLCLVGSSLFALGATMRHSSGTTRYVVMFIGRFIFGLGGGSITIVQNAITAKWFKGKELALAFGCTLTISRIGSVVNYDATPALYNSAETAYPNYGLGITLWAGAGLVTLGYLAMLGIVVFEKRAEGTAMYAAMTSCTPEQKTKDERAEADEALDESGNVRKKSFLDDLRTMPATFWFVCLVITFFYNLVFPFQAIAVDFIQTSYHGSHSTQWASTRASTVYMVSMVVSPFLGKAVDVFGRRDWLAIAGTGLSIPVFILLGQPSVTPYVPLLMLGCCYSVCAAALWPTIQQLVDYRVVGRANGVATSMQMLGIGICNIVAGALKDNNRELSKLAPPAVEACCRSGGLADTCFFPTNTTTSPCLPAKYGSCGEVKSKSGDPTFKCQGTNYTPMLTFFTGMAVAALGCALVLKWLDRHEHALYLGLRDKNAAFESKMGRLPKGDQEMADATRMARQQLRAGSARRPLLDSESLDDA